jgi:hypothetical protein
MNLNNDIQEASRYRSEGPGRKLLSEKDMKVVSKDEAKEDEQKKKKNVANKEKFEKATNLANLKADEAVEEKPHAPSLFDLIKEEKGTVAEEKPFVKEPKPEDFAPVKEDTGAQGEGLFSGEKDKKKLAGPFIQEQPDLSYVNPSQQKVELASIYTPAKPVVQQVDMVQRIKEIVDQIGKIDLYSIKEGGKTETVVVLNNIKMFEGARVVVTSFDTAKNEFNITFENLTQQGKSLLDLPKNQEALMQTLAQRGEWVIHQITTTTLAPSRPYIDEGSPQQGREGREEEDTQERERRSRK